MVLRSLDSLTINRLRYGMIYIPGHSLQYVLGLLWRICFSCIEAGKTGKAKSNYKISI